jgi:hypothetical protein
MFGDVLLTCSLRTIHNIPAKKDDGDECGTTLRLGVDSRNKGTLYPPLVIREFWVSLAIL